MRRLKDPDIHLGADEGGLLVKSGRGGFVQASEEHCLLNRWLVEPYMIRQRCAKNLDIPDVESLEPELHAAHVHRATSRKVKNGKQPKAIARATLELVQNNAHLDAKC